MRRSIVWQFAAGMATFAVIGCNSSMIGEAATSIPAPIPTATVVPAASPTLPPLIATPLPTAIPTATAISVVAPSATRAPADSQSVSNRIVYVSPDSQIYTIRPDGSDQTRLSPEREEAGPGEFVAGYTWPGWSPDGRRVLFSAALPPGLDSPYLLLSTDADGSTSEDPDVLYQNEVGSGTIVPGGPHYGLWSPDSSKVASIVSTRSGLTTLISDVRKFTTTPLAPGAPVYLSWSPDSKELLVHISDRLYRFRAPFDGPPVQLDGGTTRYFAPEYAPDDNRSAYLIDSDSGLELNVFDPISDEFAAVTDIETFAAFRWSPSGESLAVLKGDPRADDSTLWMVAADGSSEELLSTGRYEMMMWSPNGEKILLSEIDPSDTSRSTWSVMELATGEINQVVEFTPSGEIFQLQQFFDQYSASHTFWSPDSESLVFAGLVHEPVLTGEDGMRGPDTVWVVSADGDREPQAVADGFLAFWSPK